MKQDQVEFTRWLNGQQDSKEGGFFYRSLRDSTIRNLIALDAETLHAVFVPAMQYILGMADEKPAPPTTGIPQLDSLCANLQQQMLDDNFELCQAPTLSKKFGGSYGRYKRWAEKRNYTPLTIEEFQDYYRVLSEAYGRKPMYDEIQSAYDSDTHAASQQQQEQRQEQDDSQEQEEDFVLFEEVFPQFPRYSQN